MFVTHLVRFNKRMMHSKLSQLCKNV